MKFALIADSHGNTPALKAVLDDAARQAVDQYIFLGDYYVDFPYANEGCDAMRAIPGAHVISGNKEVYLHQVVKEYDAGPVHAQHLAIYQRYKELRPDTIDYLLSLPARKEIALKGRTLYLTHNPADMFSGTVIQTQLMRSSLFAKKCGRRLLPMRSILSPCRI